VICTSVWPLDHGSVMAAWTALRSAAIPLANAPNRLVAGSLSQALRPALVFDRSMAWKRSIRSRAARSAGAQHVNQQGIVRANCDARHRPGQLDLDDRR
jgi:hypothetical protein